MSRESLDHVVRGVLFDFTGWLTTREEVLTFSYKHNAAPVVEAIKEFLKLRGIESDCEPLWDWPGRCGPSQPEEVIHSGEASYNPIVSLDGGSCLFARPRRGDCENYIGLPGLSIPGQHDGEDQTVDVYGKPNGWCWSCWKSYQIDKLQKELNEARHPNLQKMLDEADEAAQTIRRLRQEITQLRQEEKDSYERYKAEWITPPLDVIQSLKDHIATLHADCHTYKTRAENAERREKLSEKHYAELQQIVKEEKAHEKHYAELQQIPKEENETDMANACRDLFFVTETDDFLIVRTDPYGGRGVGQIIKLPRNQIYYTKEPPKPGQKINVRLTSALALEKGL